MSGMSVNLGIMLSMIGILSSVPATAAAGPLGPADIRLPDPDVTGNLPVESALKRRRSVRDFSEQPLALAEAAQLLWAAQGAADPGGKRTAPSAGALYPLEIYLLAGEVAGLERGIYRYQSSNHTLRRMASGDPRMALAAAALGQSWVSQGAAVIVVAGVYPRTTGKYGQRGVRYVHLEAGHAAQNIALQALSLKLGTVLVGAFDDDKVKNIVGMADDEQPLCILPVGRPGQAAQ